MRSVVLLSLLFAFMFSISADEKSKPSESKEKKDNSSDKYFISDETEASKKIFVQLKNKISFDFSNKSLKDVCKEISTLLAIKIDLHASVDGDELIDLKVKDLEGKNAIVLILSNLKLLCKVYNGVLTLVPDGTEQPKPAMKEEEEK